MVRLIEQVESDIQVMRTQSVFKDYNAPFIWVFAASSTGKTQLAYSLMQVRKRFVYFVLMNNHYFAQTIYNASIDISIRFEAFINADLLTLKLRTDEMKSSKCLMNLNTIQRNLVQQDFEEIRKSCLMFSLVPDLKLESIGFLDAMIREGDLSEKKFFECLPMSFNEFLRRYRPADYGIDINENYKEVGIENEALPCICLDEFSIQDDEGVRVQLFARNLVRALCIVMGTNPSGAKIIRPDYVRSDGSVLSASKKIVPWVYVVNELPKATFESFPEVRDYAEAILPYKDDENWKAFFAWIESVPTCRPRFFRHALIALTKYFNNSDIKEKVPEGALWRMLAVVRLNLQLGKYTGHGGPINGDIYRWGISGQIANLLPNSQLLHIYSKSFITCYFADLVGPSGSTGPYFPLYVGADDEKYYLQYRQMTPGMPSNEKNWDSFECSLKTPAEENIGTLVLVAMLGPGGNIFFKRNTSVFTAFLTYLNKMVTGFTAQLCLSDQRTRFSYIFEHFVHLATLISSSETGERFHGTRLDEYCCVFMGNLGLNRTRLDPLILAENCELRQFCNLLSDDCPKIPLLGPLNKDYSFLRPISESLNLGKLNSTENIDGIIEMILWKGYFELELLQKKATNAGVIKICNNVISHDPDAHRRVIFIISKTAALNFNKLSETFGTNTCFFKVQGRFYDGLIKFVSSSSFSTEADSKEAMDRAKCVQNVVIILSLEFIFGQYDFVTTLTESEEFPEQLKAPKEENPNQALKQSNIATQSKKRRTSY